MKKLTVLFVTLFAILTVNAQTMDTRNRVNQLLNNGLDSAVFSDNWKINQSGCVELSMVIQGTGDIQDAKAAAHQYIDHRIKQINTESATQHEDQIVFICHYTIYNTSIWKVHTVANISVSIQFRDNRCKITVTELHNNYIDSMNQLTSGEFKYNQYPPLNIENPRKRQWIKMDEYTEMFRKFMVMTYNKMFALGEYIKTQQSNEEDNW